jgi:hypothetical protein
MVFGSDRGGGGRGGVGPRAGAARRRVAAAGTRNRRVGYLNEDIIELELEFEIRVHGRPGRMRTRMTQMRMVTGLASQQRMFAGCKAHECKARPLTRATTRLGVPGPGESVARSRAGAGSSPGPGPGPAPAGSTWK